MARTMLVFLFTLGALTNAVFAADDPSIKGQLREDIESAMRDFIDRQTVGETYRHYDPVAGKLHELELVDLHSGIVKKGDFYVSCADFVDRGGRKLDLDFLVLDAEGELRAVQAIVHKVDGSKRPYVLETTD